MREVNLDRLRELAGQLRHAVRELQEIGQAPQEAFLVEDAEVYRVIREDLGDFDRNLASVGHYLKAELT